MNLSERLKSARAAAGLTQKQVSARCGIDDSSLSAFEHGQSEPRLGQLSSLAEVYHLSLSYFLDETEPQTQLVLWRNQPDNQQEIQAEFLQLCRQYRQLEIWTDQTNMKHLPQLDDGKGHCDYRRAENLAEETRKQMGLGEQPGESLFWILEEGYGVKIFHLDLGDCGTAACAISEEFGEAILLNSKCSPWRRNHDLAHELFHLLTWKRFKHDEGICEPDQQEEKYATCFAGNLLLPGGPVYKAISEGADNEGNIPFSKLDRIARQFHVSLESLLWRMHLLFHWEESKTKEYVEIAQRYVKTVPRDHGPTPPLFPEGYRSLAIQALNSGDISLGRFAKFMSISRAAAEKFLSEGESEDAQVSTALA